MELPSAVVTRGLSDAKIAPCFEQKKLDVWACLGVYPLDMQVIKIPDILKEIG